MESITRRGFVASAAGMAAAGALAAGAGQAALADEAAATPKLEDSIEWNAVYDVVVIGMGIAGETAAIAAADEGASVLVLEKAPDGHDGGNSRYCHQYAIGVTEGMEEQGRTYFRALRGPWELPTDEKIDVFVDELVKNRSWMESLGATTYDYETAAGVAYAPEYPEFEGGECLIDFGVSPRLADGAMFKFLKQQVQSRDNIDLWFEAPATKLYRDGATGVVIGVQAEADGQTVNIRARNGVVLSAGGYEHNQRMMQAYVGVPQCLPIAALYNDGDGQLMAAGIGAQLSGMENVMAYINCTYEDGATPEWNSGTRIGKASYTTSLLFVGSDGTRFMNENFKSRHGYMPWHGSYISQRVPYPAYCVFDEAAKQDTTFSHSLSSPEQIDEGVENGRVVKADTLESLAEAIGVPSDALRATVDRFNEFAEEGEDKEFHRAADCMRTFGDGPYYAFSLVQSALNTQGGPYRDENAQILDNADQPIAHLYGAGECGEIYTSLYNGSGNLGGCLAFGRIAGRNAAAAKDDDQPAADLAVTPFEYVPAEKRTFEAGENQYVATVDAHAGDLTVRVTMDGDTISEVEVLQSGETPFIGGKALDTLCAEVAGKTLEEAQQIDTVSHATLTSEYFIQAITEALAQR